MSDDNFVINTGANIPKEKKLDPLPLYDDLHPMLSETIPEYELGLPNVNMTNLVKRMKMTMKQFGGIGLSANQCGVFERVFIIGTEHFQFVCINPKIINSSAQMIKGDEGCLSYPGLYLKIERPEWIEAQFYDETGIQRTIRLDGVTARCYQHELDHMNGIKFTQLAGPVTLRLAKQKQEKIIKRILRQKKYAK